MKTLKTLLTAVMLIVVVFNSSAADKNLSLKRVPANAAIKKVIVTGNTRVTLIQSNTEWISVGQENIEKIAVKQIGDALTINSSEDEPIAVTVYVKNPFRIDVSNQSDVKTVGKFNVEFLQVILKDRATARIQANTKSLYTIINNHSKLELIGATDKHILKMDEVAILKTDKFAALTTTREAKGPNSFASNKTLATR